MLFALRQEDFVTHPLSILLGYQTDEHLARRFPGLVQITWEEVLIFIHQRFTQYREQKMDHGTWRQDGHKLWERSAGTEGHFVSQYLAGLKG